MWIRDPGKIVDSLDFLGIHNNCLYLLKGREAMIIGGAMSSAAPSLEKQFSAMDFELDRLKYLVVTHSHFDHCGAVPYLKRKFPHVQILASEYSEKVFSRDKAVNFIAVGNKRMIDSLGLQGEYERLNLKFDGIKVDRVITEKDVIDLGDGIEVHFMEVPGHTQCSIAVYVPKLKALFPSDSAPFPTDDVNRLAFPSAQYDFGMYKESLEKMASCEVNVCAFEHHGAVTGDLARKVLGEGLMFTEKMENHIIELYQQMGDLDKVAQKVATEAMEWNKLEFLNMELMMAVSKAEIRNVLRYAKIISDAPAP